MENSKTVTIYRNEGLSLSSLLGVAFIVLKLTNVITWSWVWVLSPFWIPLAFVLALWGLILLIWGIAVLFTPGKKRRKRYF